MNNEGFTTSDINSNGTFKFIPSDLYENLKGAKCKKKEKM